MKSWFKRRTKQELEKFPWLRQRIQKSRSQLRNKRAYAQRAKSIPRLADQYGIKSAKTSSLKQIIIISVDALRKDHLSLYGYERETTPFLKSLAEDAAVFENAITPAPWTYPSVASILTGLYPHNHGGVFSDDPRNMDDGMLPNRIRQDIITLPEVLSQIGFKTFFSSAIITAELPITGCFNDLSVYYAEAEQHINTLLRWMKKDKGRKSFIFCHLGDLHSPIIVPDRYSENFGKIPDIPKLKMWDFQEGPYQDNPFFEQYKENRLKLYDSALFFLDNQIARLVDYLKGENLLDSTLIFITSDHGDEFWDHVELERKLFHDPRGYYGVGHGHNLFQEVINVPLIALGPGITPGYYTQNVSLVDLTMTILEVCGIKHKLELDGSHLFDQSNERIILSEDIAYGYEKKALFQDNWKLLHSEGDRATMLFDLACDPGEECNLAKTNLVKLEKLLAVLSKAESKGEPLKIDRGIKKQLQDLGYL